MPETKHIPETKYMSESKYMPETFQTYSFTFSEVAPSVGELLDFLQAADSDESHPVRACVDELLAQLSGHNGITGGYIIKGIEELNLREGLLTINSTIGGKNILVNHSEIHSDDNFAHSEQNIELTIGRQVAHYLKGSSHVALFLCTAGDIFTRLTKELNAQGDFMEAFVADAIGSLTVERAMDYIQSRLSVTLEAEALSITNRYSPGYCNWHLSGQQNLFRLIGHNPVGVSLSDSCLMSPIKSVSGVIGIGKDIRRQEYGCNVCGDSACIYRQRKHASS